MREREGKRERYTPAHAIDPGHCDELCKPNEEQRHSGSKLIKQLKQVDTVAKDERKRDQKEQETDNG